MQKLRWCVVVPSLTEQVYSSRHTCLYVFILMQFLLFISYIPLSLSLSIHVGSLMTSRCCFFFPRGKKQKQQQQFMINVQVCLGTSEEGAECGSRGAGGGSSGRKLLRFCAVTTPTRRISQRRVRLPDGSSQICALRRK